MIGPQTLVDIRVRVEDKPHRRALGLINDFDDDAGWLVLACEGASVLEMRMLPGEYAFETGRRFREAADITMANRGPEKRTARAVLLSHLLLEQRRMDLAPRFKPSAVTPVRIIAGDLMGGAA